jgi:hypothetical protein
MREEVWIGQGCNRRGAIKDFDFYHGESIAILVVGPNEQTISNRTVCKAGQTKLTLHTILRHYW